MWIRTNGPKLARACAAIAVILGTVSAAQAAGEKPVAGKQVHFTKGSWSALPQKGPDGKVRQCVLVALRSRTGGSGSLETRLAFGIGRGAGFAISITDREVPSENILDDEAEIFLDGGAPFPTVAFPVGPSFAMHPGDAAAVLVALEKAITVRLRSDGAGFESGPIPLNLPGEALSWLKRCGTVFNIPIDRPSDPNAPDLPKPRPRSPELLDAQPSKAGPAGIEDKQKINGWDASELRGADGRVAVCFIRRHYLVAAKPGVASTFATFLMVSRAKGLSMMLKHSSVSEPEGKPIEASMSIGGKAFTDFSARMLGNDEIGIFPQHATALARALDEYEAIVDFKSKVLGVQTSTWAGAMAWARACSRRHGIAIEPGLPDAHALFKAGFDARVAGDHEAAIRLLSDAIASGSLNDDDRATSYNNRGIAFAAKGEDDKAVADYTMAIKIAKLYGPAYLNRGNIYSNQGKFDAALSDYNFVITISPSYALAYNSRGAVYYRRGELDAALADFDKAIQLKPDYGNAFWNRARVYSRKDDTPKALADFAEAIRFKSSEPELYFDRGNLRSATGDDAGAIADFTKSIALNPDDQFSYNNRGNSYFAIGEIDKAIADFDSAIKLTPNFSDPLISRGRIALFHSNRPAAAAQDLAEGVRLDPKDVYAAIWLHIARARSGSDDRQELVGNAERPAPGPWPAPLLNLFLGKTTAEGLRAVAAEAKDDSTRQEQLCEADFYIGILKLEKHAVKDAKNFLSAAADHCPVGMLEKPAAKAELARLILQKPESSPK